MTLATLVAASVALPQQPFGLDPTFRTSLIWENVNDVFVRDDGNLIITGRLRFSGDSPGTENWRSSALLSPTGSRLPGFPETSHMGGRMTQWQDRLYSRYGCSRNFMDGSIDTTFAYYPQGPTGYSYGQFGDYHVFPDGRVLLAGWYFFPAVIGEDSDLYSLLWLDNTGHVDTTRTQRLANGGIWTIKELPEGKFICSSGATIYDGHPVPFIFRIEADGSLDTTFHAPSMNLIQANSFYLTPDGKVVVGGFFNIVNAPDTVNLIRLMPDGQLDPSFNPHTDYNASYVGIQQYYYAGVSSIQPLGQDRLIIVGGFDEIDGQERGGIALLDTAGNLLDDYFSGTGCGVAVRPPGVNPQLTYKFVTGIRPAPDGSYYILGAYNGFDDGTTNDTLQRFVSRLYGLNVGIADREQFKPSPLAITPNPTKGNTTITVEAPLLNAQLTLYDASGRVALQVAWPTGQSQSLLPAGALAPGAYVANVREGANTRYTGRFVVLP